MDARSKTVTDILHILGNLTLTGYNPELGKMPFAGKHAFYRDSHVEFARGANAGGNLYQNCRLVWPRLPESGQVGWRDRSTILLPPSWDAIVHTVPVPDLASALLMSGLSIETMPKLWTSVLSWSK